MTKIIEKKICDVCKKEVECFKGSLIFKYGDSDFTGCSFPVKFEHEDICIDCCRKLDKALTEVIKKIQG